MKNKINKNFNNLKPYHYNKIKTLNKIKVKLLIIAIIKMNSFYYQINKIQYIIYLDNLSNINKITFI